MLGGWGGLLSSTARGPSGPFCFSSAGVDVFRLHCICDASIFVAFVSYCGVHATRRFLLHLYLIAMSMRRVDFCCICILLQCPCDASILLKILCKLSITTANEIELPPPMCFLICTTFMFLVYGFFHQTGAIKTRTFTCIHVYYMS